MPDLESLPAAFRQSFHSDPQVVVRAPGRVNLIGEHTDYNDGYALPMAIDRAVWIAAAACPSPLASLTALDFHESATFRITELQAGRPTGWIAYPASGQPNQSSAGSPGWAAYPAGVAWALRDAGLTLTGLDAVVTSDVPIASGLSSSAAMEVAFAATWEQLGGFRLPRSELARLCQRAENEYVGVRCGIMDQTISAAGRAGHAMLLDCRDLSTQHIPLPPGYAIVVSDTRVRRSLGASAYNERRAQCEEAVQRLRLHLPAIQALRDVTPELLARHEAELPDAVRRRARHVVSENARVLSAVEALRRGDMAEFGRAMVASHVSLRDDYEVSCAELDALVGAAVRVDGVLGARMTGGGFGGCTVSLVRQDAVERYLREVPTAYQAATGIQPAVYVCQAADGASVVAKRG